MSLIVCYSRKEGKPTNVGITRDSICARSAAELVFVSTIEDAMTVQNAMASFLRA